MGICTQCGMLLHDDDDVSHICDPNDKPEKGKPIKKGLKKSDVQ